ncbi:uncharacterized protein LOC106160248 [Lingula anatina]|uniref:Uncharacterized protein LOC106160248 n=1 Tax=Lingula anatina TaxID=7574 RepID=A0A1S3I1V2_LINAN|nr:uncharacterized protein LOC106160248 [Lingula anatina]XP_023930320.1 uncharacterized protein LOC106160248 [Lingula anatina]|eukprot:XP_013392245.2 uncharacterized protein LOC106160248 [Lingula anatina]
MKIPLFLCVVALTAYLQCTGALNHKHCGPHHINKPFVCPDEYLPGGSYTQKVPIKSPDGYGQKISYRIETVTYGPSKKLYFAFDGDKTCYWQCDSQGVATLRPCPTKTVFKEDLQTCLRY